MNWETPVVEEIKMDAEIGSYQVDDEERTPDGAREAARDDERAAR